MEKIFLTKKEFDRMHEYSCSLPTGTSYGKVWKCNKLAYASPPGEDWWMAEYVPDPQSKINKDGDPETVKINWRKIEVEDGTVSHTQPAIP